MVIGEVDIGTIPSTLIPTTQATMVDCCVYLLIIFMSVIVFMTIVEVVVGVIMEYVEVGLNN